MDSNVDKTNFVATILIILLVSVPLALYPESGARIMQRSYQFVATNFGWLYLLAGAAALVLLLWLAFGRFGNVKLGTAQDQPEFSTYSWIAMLFCAGIGAGLMFWSTIEWAYYYQSPPFGAQPKSLEAAKWASSYGVFHWGFIAWAFYCLPSIAIAYPFYARKVPVLKYSVACNYWLAGREEGGFARLMDFLFMLALIGGAGSSLGFSTPLVAALLSWLTGIETGFGMQVAVLGLCVAIFATSVFLGLERGMKRLSDLNLLLALLLLVFVLVAGPTLFLIKTAVSSVGTVLQNFVAMSTWVEPFTNSRFVEDWTVFYWAWWIAYGPFVGLFVTRISRGRTIREVVLGMLIYGSLGCALFYLILGNYSLNLQLSGELDVVSILQEQGGNQAIIAGFERLPWPGLVIFLFFFVSIIFSATTYDSASHVLASSASHNFRPGQDAPRWHRTFWAVALAILPLTLMYIGGLKVAQTAVLVVSLPILLTGIISSCALVLSLKQDHPRAQDRGQPE